MGEGEGATVGGKARTWLMVEADAMVTGLLISLFPDASMLATNADEKVRVGVRARLG